jgi:hypothetical protein
MVTVSDYRWPGLTEADELAGTTPTRSRPAPHPQMTSPAARLAQSHGVHPASE